MENEFKIVLDIISKGDVDGAVNKMKEFAQVSKDAGTSFAASQRMAKEELAKTTLEIKKLETANKSLNAGDSARLQKLQAQQKGLREEVALYGKINREVSEAYKKSSSEQLGLLAQQKNRLKELRAEAEKAANAYDLSKINKEIDKTSSEIKRLKSNTGELARAFEATEKSYEEITQRNRQLRAEMNKLPIKDVTGDLARMQKEYERNNDVLKDFDRSLGQNSRNVGNYEQAIDNALSKFNLFGVNAGGVKRDLADLGNAFKTTATATNVASGSTTGFIGVLKALKIALVSVGIGVFLIALGSIVSLFTRFQGAIDAVNAKLAGLSSTIDVIADRLGGLAQAFGQIFQGNFSQGINGVTASFKGLGTQLVDTFTQAQQLERDLQKLRDAEIELISVQAARNEQIAEFRLATKNINLDIKERLRLAEAANALELKNEEDQLRNAQERVRIYTAQAGLANNLAEDNRKLAEAEAEVSRISEQSLNKRRELQENITTLIREQEAANKLLADQERLAGEARIKLLEEGKAALQEFRRETRITGLILANQVDEEFKRLGSSDELKSLVEQSFSSIEEKAKENMQNFQKVFTENQRELTEIALEEERKRAELQRNVADVAQTVNQSIGDLGRSAREKELEQIEETERRKLELVKGNAREEERIRKEAARQRAQIRRKEAIAQKREALFSIAIRIAQALAAGNIFQAAIAGVQLGVVAATPIPRFKRGTNFAPGGPAFVGEAGHELIKYPNQKYALSPNRTTLIDLPQGSQVFTHEKTREILKTSPDIFNSLTQIKPNPEKVSQKVMVNSPAQPTPAPQVINQYIPDERGLRRFQIIGHSRIESANRRNSLLNRKG